MFRFLDIIKIEIENKTNLGEVRREPLLLYGINEDIFSNLFI